MTFDADHFIIGFAGVCLGWAIRSSVAIGQIRSDLDKMDARMTDVARREAQHSVAGVKQVVADHERSISLHGERLTHLTTVVEQMNGR